MKSSLTVVLLLLATSLMAQPDPDIRPALEGYSVIGQNTQMRIVVGLDDQVTDLYGIAFKAHIFDGASVDYYFEPWFSIGDEWRECESFYDAELDETYEYCMDEYIYFATVSQDGKTIDVGISKVDGSPISGSFDISMMNLVVNNAGQHVLELFDVSAQDVNGDPIPMIVHAETFTTYQIPDAPGLISPVSSPVRINKDYLYEWENIGADHYQVEFFTYDLNEPFASYFPEQNYIGTGFHNQIGKTLRWRVRGVFPYGITDWSDLGYFVIEEERSIGFVDGLTQFDEMPVNLFPVVKVVSGFGMTGALFEDGSIQVWGADVFDNGYLIIPENLPPLRDLWAGWNHFVAQDSSGNLHMWGHFGDEEVVGDPGLTDVVMVAPGLDHNVFLLSDGTVEVRGFDNHGILDVPVGLDSVVTITSGPSHALALTASGRVVAWGRNFSGETDVPADLNRVASISAGDNRSLALLDDGSVRMWPNPEEIPANVVNGSAVSIASGVYGHAAVMSDGTLEVWGFSELTPFLFLFELNDIVSVSISSGGPNDQQIIVIRSSEFIPSIPVWPGEVNLDDVVSAADILNIGLFFGQSGTSNNPGTTWQSYLRHPWSADGDTPRRIYADTNGDGFIDESDVSVLGFNYGNQVGVFNKRRPSFVADVLPITLNAELTRNEAGDRVLRIRMDESSYLYGLSMRIAMDQDQLQPSLWMGDADVEHPIRFQKWLPQQKEYALALSRTDQVDVQVQGVLFDVRLNRSISTDAISFRRVKGYLSDGRVVEVDVVVDPMVTSVEDGADVPRTTSLLQNYPNPFNPSTSIRWNLAEPSAVSIRLVDMLGRDIGQIVAGEYAAGSHAVLMDAASLSLSSGTYLVVMDVKNNETGLFSRHTNKLLLIK